MLKDKKAFTLIELLVVVAIIGILAAVGVVAYNGYTSSAKASAVKSNHALAVKLIMAQLTRANIDNTIESWNTSTNKCEFRNASTASNAFEANFNYAFSCLNNDPQYTNPFNSTDNEGAFWQYNAVPTTQYVGRTACNYKQDDNKIYCNSRYGTEANDILSTIINEP